MRPLPRAVLALGWVSLFTDAAADMVMPLVPALLLSVGSGYVALGLIEGVAESVSAAVKIGAGVLADRFPRKPIVALGYTLSTLSRPAFAFVASTGGAVFVRSLDRIGKGLRGPPRDAILADLVGPEDRGRAFGLHRMMDNLGGVVGPVLAFVLLQLADLPLRTVFLLSILPGLLSVATVLAFVREAPRPDAGVPAASDAPARDHPPVPATARARLPFAYFVALALFSLAGSGDLFLLARLGELGLPVAVAPIAWMGLQLGKAMLNVPGGRASDRYGRRRVLALSWWVYAAAYLLFGFAPTLPIAILGLAVHAVHYGLAEGGQRALLAELVPAHARGRAFGASLAVEGAAILPANLGFGVVYERWGAPTAFLGAAALAAAGALALLAVRAPSGARS